MQSTMPSPTRRKWRFLREALGGTTQDFTQGSLSRGIALLAIPTILEMVMESTFGVVDAFWVARLGPDAMAAVGLTEAVVVLVFAIAMGLAMAATATVARRIGEHDPEGASVAAVQAIVAGVVLAILMGIAGYAFAPRLLEFMHATPSVIQTGTGYARIILGGNLAIVMIFLINGIFRGSGDAAIAMRTLWMANLINLALDPCFIYGLGPFPKLGVTGAAVATTTGRSLGVLYQLYVLAGGRARVAVARRHLRLDWPVMARLLRVARSAMLAVLHRDCKLAQSGADQLRVRQPCGGGLLAGDPHHPVCADALVGHLFCRRYPGGTEPGSETSRSERARGVARRAV